MALFDTPALPAWLQGQSPLAFSESSRRDFDNKLAGFISLQDLKMRKEQERQRAVMAPLLMQQMESELKSKALDVATKQQEQADYLKNKEGWLKLAEFQAGMTGTDQLTDPAQRQKYFELGAKFPWLTSTDAWRTVLDNLQKARFWKHQADLEGAKQSTRLLEKQLDIISKESISTEKAVTAAEIAEANIASRETIAGKHDAVRKEIARINAENRGKTSEEQAAFELYKTQLEIIQKRKYDFSKGENPDYDLRMAERTVNAKLKAIAEKKAAGKDRLDYFKFKAQPPL